MVPDPVVGTSHQSNHYRRRSRMNHDEFRRAIIIAAAARSVRVPNAATIGTMDAVWGSRFRVVLARATFLPLVATEFDAFVLVACVTAGTSILGSERPDDAIVPSCAVPVGVADVGFVSALTVVSVPDEETRARSDVSV